MEGESYTKYNEVVPALETLINRKVSETLDRVEAELPKGSFYTPESLEGKIYWEAIAEVKKAISKIRGEV